ncbi:MAG: PspA/IM30 family protein, partial [bacterium]
LTKRAEGRPASAASFAEALEQTIEPPREIPPAIRVWLARTNQASLARPLLAAYLGAGLLAVGIAAGAAAAAVGAALLIGGGLVVLPPLMRLQQVLQAGYGIDDLRMAIREYWARRREEIDYELKSPPAAISPAKALAIFGFSSITTVLLQAIGGVSTTSWVAPVPALAATVAVASGVLTFGRFIRLKTNKHLGSSQIKFYNSKWGERLVRLAGIGVKKRVPTQSLPQLTEIALGRATDALYDALPKPVQKLLKQLPPTVRRLENDAKALREEIEKLDASLVSLEAPPASVGTNAERLRLEHERLRVDLQRTRDRASDRLAATVAALETIRLDLLRLQLGDGTVDSVTASLDAAHEVVAELGAYADATREVERSLRPPPTLAPRTSLP